MLASGDGGLTAWSFKMMRAKGQALRKASKGQAAQNRLRCKGAAPAKQGAIDGRCRLARGADCNACLCSLLFPPVIHRCGSPNLTERARNPWGIPFASLVCLGRLHDLVRLRLFFCRPLVGS